MRSQPQFHTAMRKESIQGGHFWTVEDFIDVDIPVMQKWILKNVLVTYATSLK